MKICITGGCGFLGHHIVQHLLSTTEAEIVILDKLSYASSGFDRLREIGAYEHPRVKIIGCDVSKEIPKGVRQEIGSVDYIIHTAAETHVDHSIKDPVPFLESNVLGTHHLLWMAKSILGLKRIFLISTDEAYGPADFGDDVKGFDEEAPFRPANPYAAAKAGGECLGMAYANTYKLPITIVSTMNLLGERQLHEKFAPLVMRNVLLGEQIFIHADPTKTISGTRFYIHCRNFASALSFLIEQDLQGIGLYGQKIKLPIKIHVAGEREISNLDLAKLIAKFVGKPLYYQMTDFHSERPGHDLRYCLDDSRIRSMGWQQPVDIEHSLEKTVQWYLNNKHWLGL